MPSHRTETMPKRNEPNDIGRIHADLHQRQRYLDGRINRLAYELGAYDALNDALDEALDDDVRVAVGRIRDSLLFSCLILGCNAFAPETRPDDVSFRSFHKPLADSNFVAQFQSYSVNGSGPLEDENRERMETGTQNFLDGYQEGIGLHGKLKPTRDKALAHFSLANFEKPIVQHVVDIACVAIELNDALHMAILATSRDGMSGRWKGHEDTVAMLGSSIILKE